VQTSFVRRGDSIATQFDAAGDPGDHSPVPRVLAAIVALGLSVAFLASPAPGDARANRKPSPTLLPAAPLGASPAPARSLAFVDGIDVSQHQKAIDWSRVAGAGKQFAYVRATAGTLTADATYDRNRAGARAAGLTVGSYHYANPQPLADDAAMEAAWFLRNATVASGDLLPVLDLELSNGLAPVALIAWAQTWLETVERATGVKPVIYTTPVFWARSMAGSDWFARNGYRLWIAHWTRAGGPAVPAADWGGDGWTLWQVSSTGRIPGIRGAVDLDRFAGSSLTAAVLVP
jgi:GH25 family lysozyme M1 (1,4-beta-N-acetylmuramidase)